MDWNAPLFPDLFPKLTDPLWFNVDNTTDDDTELTQLEHEHTTWLNSIAEKNCGVLPIGKSAAEVQEEEDEDDDEEDDNDDDDTDTHDDDEDEDIVMEVPYNQ